MILNNARIADTLKTIVISDGVIVSVCDKPEPSGFDVGGKRIIPGLIDVHTHGLCGNDTMDADFRPLCLEYAKKGTTSFLPTTMTMDYKSLLRVTQSPTDFYGANILGFHLEGPFIAESRKGAQDARNIKNPSVRDFESFQNVSMITVAPEKPGGIEFIRAVSDKCVVSIGHTDCDYGIAKKAISSGACCLTHTFNAMPPLLHRSPGPIGAAVEDGIYAQLICDGFHVAPAAVIAAYKMFGADRLVLISDSIRPAGMPDGVYNCGGLDVTLHDGSARLSDGTIAGSVASLFDCLKSAVSFGIPFDDAVKTVTETPARLLKVNKGQIKPGFDADLIILDDDMNIDTVIIMGEVFDC